MCACDVFYGYFKTTSSFKGKKNLAFLGCFAAGHRYKIMTVIPDEIVSFEQRRVSKRDEEL